MRKLSAVQAKAHFSELVADAERGTVTAIQKHGRTAAIVGPVALLESKKPAKRRGMTPEEIAALWASFEGQGDPNVSAVEDSDRRPSMRLCLDASVAVAAHRTKEPSHAEARARVERVLAGKDEIIVPALFPVEIASALARVGVDAKVALAYVERLLAGAELVTLGPKRAPRIMAVAVRTRLRAADAAYAWVAGRANVALLTLDAELLTRACLVCAVERP